MASSDALEAQPGPFRNGNASALPTSSVLDPSIIRRSPNAPPQSPLTAGTFGAPLSPVSAASQHSVASLLHLDTSRLDSSDPSVYKDPVLQARLLKKKVAEVSAMQRRMLMERLQRRMGLLLSGIVVMKHHYTSTNKGTRILKLSANKKILQWSTPSAGNAAPSSLDMKTVKGVLFGCKSRVFQRLMDDEEFRAATPQWHCFSLVTQSRTVDFSVADEDQLVEIILGLQTAMRNPLMEWTRGDLLARRGWMKLTAQANAEGVSRKKLMAAHLRKLAGEMRNEEMRQKRSLWRQPLFVEDDEGPMLFQRQDSSAMLEQAAMNVRPRNLSHYQRHANFVIGGRGVAATSAAATGGLLMPPARSLILQKNPSGLSDGSSYHRSELGDLREEEDDSELDESDEKWPDAPAADTAVRVKPAAASLDIPTSAPLRPTLSGSLSRASGSHSAAATAAESHHAQQRVRTSRRTLHAQVVRFLADVKASGDRTAMDSLIAEFVEDQLASYGVRLRDDSDSGSLRSAAAGESDGLAVV